MERAKRDKSYIWVVDRSSAVWNTIDAKSEDLETKIAALRASLDPSSNKPFDAKLAYELYKLILGPVEDSIAKKPRLLMVMNGALTSLPPQVLVTRDPAGMDLKSTDWLIRRHAIAILPSVYSLKVLRGEKAKDCCSKAADRIWRPRVQEGRHGSRDAHRFSIEATPASTVPERQTLMSWPRHCRRSLKQLTSFGLSPRASEQVRLISSWEVRRR